MKNFFTVNKLACHFGGYPKTIYRRLSGDPRPQSGPVLEDCEERFKMVEAIEQAGQQRRFRGHGTNPYPEIKLSCPHVMVGAGRTSPWKGRLKKEAARFRSLQCSARHFPGE